MRGQLLTAVAALSWKQIEQVAPLPVGLHPGRRLLQGRKVAADGLTEVMDEADLDEAAKVYIRKAVVKEERHEAEPPRVVGHALLPSARGVAGADGILQALGTAEEIEETIEVGMAGRIGMVIGGCEDGMTGYAHAGRAGGARLGPAAARGGSGHPPDERHAR